MDIGLPLLAYYGLRGASTPAWWALLAATLVSATRVLWVSTRRRQFTWFSVMMLAVFGVGLVLAFVGGDARLMLLKDSVATMAIAATFLLSLLGARPLTFSAAQTWRPSQADVLDRLYRDEPAARSAFRVSSIGWGIGLMAESILRIPLIMILPTDVAVGGSTAWMIGAMVALTIWNMVYIARAARRTPALRPLLPGGGVGS